MKSELSLLKKVRDIGKLIGSSCVTVHLIFASELNINDKGEKA